jgi:hypothetical protein
VSTTCRRRLAGGGGTVLAARPRRGAPWADRFCHGCSRRFAALVLAIAG